MDNETAKKILIGGLVIIGIAVLIGPTSSTTERVCESQPFGEPLCYNVEVPQTNPMFYLLLPIGGLATSISLTWLVISSAVRSGMSDSNK